MFEAVWLTKDHIYIEILESKYKPMILNTHLSKENIMFTYVRVYFIWNYLWYYFNNIKTFN